MMTRQHLARYDQGAIKGFRTLSVFLFATLAFLLVSACAPVGPDYVPPEPPSRKKWHTDLENGLRPRPVDVKTLAAWWTTLQDPILSDLIEEAVGGNLDLKKARSRVREARARRGISRAGLFPLVDAAGAAAKFRDSETSGTGREANLYSAGFDAGWELDVFGGVRRSVEAAQADLEAGQANLRDVLVSLAAEVALNYVELRTYQHRLDVAQANLNSQQKTYDLIRSRFEAGLSNELALQQASYNLEDTRSRIPSLRRGLEAAKNRLAVLTGQPPGALHDVLYKRQPVPVPPASVAVGVPAETLRRRPDIQRAERALAAQTARIGVATADLYPKFRLAGSIGLESLSSGNFLDAASQLWSVGPGISWRIFDAGAIRKNIEVQSALQEQALLDYEAVVLVALEEVENAMTAYAEEQLRRERLIQAVRAAEKAELLAQDQYRAGLVDFSDVLDAQRAKLSFQDQLARSEGTVTGNLIGLYKALGGGWSALGKEKGLKGG